jgi:hypothetical protein
MDPKNFERALSFLTTVLVIWPVLQLYSYTTPVTLYDTSIIGLIARDFISFIAFKLSDYVENSIGLALAKSLKYSVRR